MNVLVPHELDVSILLGNANEGILRVHGADVILRAFQNALTVCYASGLSFGSRMLPL